MSRSARKGVITAAALVVALAVVFIAVRGCTLMPWAKKGGGASVSVSITRDFGETVIRSRSAEARAGDSVMDVLESVADMKTEYGGGFVSSIEGLKSSPGTGGGYDWFYYVNGVLAGVGSAEYEVAPGDHLWWDYHPWNSENFIPAVVGSYPAPFSHGYSGEGTTTVLYGEGLESAAKEIGGFLEGQGARVDYRGSLEERDAAGAKGPVIVVCATGEAAEADWIRSPLDVSGRSGSFLSLEGDSLVPLDLSGKPAEVGEGLVAAVVATGSGTGDASPVWLVLCAGKEGSVQAVRLLVTQPRTLRLKAGVVAGSSGAVYRLPRQVRP